MSTDATEVDQPEPTVAELHQRIADLEALADRRLIELRHAARQLYALEVRRQSLGWTGQSTEDLIATQHRLARVANEGPRPADHFEHCARALARQLREVSVEFQNGPAGWVQLKSWVADKVEALLDQDPVLELLHDPVLTAVSADVVAGVTVIHTAAYEAVARAVDHEVCDEAPSASAVRSATRLLGAIDRRPEIPRPLTFIAGAGGLNLEWHHVDDRSLSVAVDNDGTFTLHRFGIEHRIDGTDDGAIWHEDRPANEVEQVAELIASLELPHEKLQPRLDQIPEVPTPAQATSTSAGVLVHPKVIEVLTRSVDEQITTARTSEESVRSASALLDHLELRLVVAPAGFVSEDGGFELRWRHVDPRALSVMVGNDGSFTVHRLGIDGTDEGAVWQEDVPATEVATVATQVALLLAEDAPDGEPKP